MDRASLRRPVNFLLVSSLVLLIATSNALITDENEGAKFLQDLDPVYLKEGNTQMKARWQYMTDITDEHSQAQIQANVNFLEFQKKVRANVTLYDYEAYNDVLVKREFQYLNIIGAGALETEDAERYAQLSDEMETVYNTAKICPFDNQNCETPTLPLDPDLTEIMATSSNYNELEYVWIEWHEAAGKPIREKYIEFVGLNNKAAEANGYDDMGSLWNKYYLYEGYSEDQFKSEIEQLWLTVKPLYEQLYSYVRRALSTTIYKDQLQRNGRLPAHVLGNMWAQQWGNIGKYVLPFPEAPPVDATPEMINKGYTARQLFDLSDTFFVDLGFDKMTDTFWDESMIERPSDREVQCHASAEEFFFGPGDDTNVREDWRIKMCTTITQEDFVTIHHEMGHIQYFMNYRNQHWVFRNGANPGFHEAIGDTIALAVSTPAHLQKLGLLPATKSSKTKPLFDNLPPLPEGVSEQDLNYLLSQALEKITFIPFGYLMDKWRWSVFSGETTNANFNAEWWNLREELQGLKPPVDRTESDFDPGAKYHIPANVEYIRYFVSFITQFQFYEALCREAGEYPANPLYKCDFDGSKTAGAKLRKMLEPGFSLPWPDAMKELTGNPGMNAQSLIDYFKPLSDWLEEANALSGECIGWNCEAEAAAYMKDVYEPTTSGLYHNATVAEWNYNTNINDANQEEMTKWYVELGKYTKDTWEQIFTQYEYETFEDDSLKRQFELLQTLGVSALSEEDLNNRTNVIGRMTTQYSSSKICPYDKKDSCKEEEKLYLEPSLEEILVTSTDYDELSYVWSEWRLVASRPMKNDYEQYVELNDKAAKANGKEDMSVLWIEPYETENFPQQLEGILNQTRPLYEKLHAYTRMKLRERYGKDKIPQEKGSLPASVLGNMWGQSWEALYDLLAPFPDAGTVDVTEEMQKQEWTVERMFETAEEFYESLGLQSMPTSYGSNSMIEKPEGRDVVCHASAWDFSDGKDFRIKMCTNVNMVDLITIHHEQGHIQYFQQYKDQPVTFRTGANPGFHEAIGDVMALSASTPGHLNKIGLIPNFVESDESDLNFLMKTALEKVTFLPFAYVMDSWRWAVFQDKYQPNDWMKEWVKLTEQYQGILPPTVRYQDDFDPGAKYHIAADVEYSRYFVANVLQFQIHKELCKVAGQFDPEDPEKPLYRCDIYNSKEAGKIMETLLKAGLSQPWRVTLMEAIGTDELDASAILDYFKPLSDYLDEQIKLGEEPVGWDLHYEDFYRAKSRECSGWDCEAEAAAYMNDVYEPTTSGLYHNATVAEWNYNTNINDANQEEMTKWYVELGKYTKATWEQVFTKYEYETFEDDSLKRQFELLQTLGVSALSEEDLNNRTNVIGRMTTRYSSSKICPYDKKDSCTDEEKLYLEPSLEEILVTSTDYDELSYVWSEWRFVASRPMKNDYEQYVELNDKAAKANGKEDMSVLWIEPYETENFPQQLEGILNQTRPLYEKLHAYTRMKLRERYGKDKIPQEKGSLPASVLGNMWGQSWEALYDLLAPFPDAGTVDVTEEMQKQEWTVKRMFETAEEFYESLGLQSMPTSYGSNSMIEKPEGRDVVCHASAWDFSDGKDFRIKMCTNVNMVDLITIHHEQGHIQYYQQYKDQPVTFRAGANPGFHEAIGDVMVLSASTPGHLNKIGLIPNFVESDESDLNFLMKTALEKVTFLPFAYVMDSWRWAVFQGKYQPDDWMKEWVKLTEQYQGILPPTVRYQDDFDPGAKYHIAADVEYSRYFVANVLQFQIHKKLCEVAGQFDPNDPEKPLYRCDIYNSKEAGKIMETLLKAGLSQPWRVTLMEAIGADELNASAVLDYFKPLSDYLDEQIKLGEEPVGWDLHYEDFYRARGRDEEPEINNTVPIIVGCVLAALVVIVIIAYFIGRSRNQKKHKQLSGQDNPTSVTLE